MKKKVPTIDPTGIYNLKEMREILRISSDRARELIRSGKIKAVKMGKSYKVLGQEIIEFLKK